MQPIISKPAMSSRLQFGQLRVHEESFWNVKSGVTQAKAIRDRLELNAYVFQDEVAILDECGIDIFAKLSKTDALALNLVPKETQDFDPVYADVLINLGDRSTCFDTLVDRAFTRVLARSIPYLAGKKSLKPSKESGGS